MPDTPTVHRFPCQACGADLRFDPTTGGLTCDQCGQREDLPARPAPPRELDYEQARAAQLPESEIEETRVITCENCGARFDLGALTHAGECPYCATPIVTDTGTQRQIKPGGVLPFSWDEESAREAMGKWLGSLWFAPDALKQFARKGRRLQGIYVPYWTYDAASNSRYRGQRGINYHETRSVRRNGKTVQQRVTKTRWSSVSGRVARDFDDVLVLAARSLPKDYTDALEPWDLNALQAYMPEYLAGFRAEGYTVDVEDGFAEAHQIIDRIIENDVRRDIGGDKQRIASVDTVLSDVTFKHVLLPVWLAAYKFRGKSYRFVVNGRTGEVKGERPYSKIKIAFAALLVAVVAAGVGYFLLLENQ